MMVHVLQSTTAARNAFKYVQGGMLSYDSGRICLAISYDNVTKVEKRFQKTNGIRVTESGLFLDVKFRVIGSLNKRNGRRSGNEKSGFRFSIGTKRIIICTLFISIIWESLKKMTKFVHLLAVRNNSYEIRSEQSSWIGSLLIGLNYLRENNKSGKRRSYRIY